MKNKYLQAIARVVAFVFVITISLYIFTIPEEKAHQLQAFGYPGVFLLSIIGNATVLLPAPSLLIVFSMGAKLNPAIVAWSAGAGAAIGELSGYLAGYSGQAIIENNKFYQQIVGWIRKHGYLTILILAFLPNPFFDLTGIAAGALRMPLKEFIFWCFIGKTFKMLLFAYAGAGAIAIPWLNDLLTP
jgi:uncharacterized membrane protein YdjX (TVP38/TMEM64 family)